MRWTIVTVGDIKSKEIRKLFDAYRKRLGRCTVHTIKDSDIWEEKVGQFLAGKDHVFLLSEDGMQYDSVGLAKFCEREGRDGDELVFVIAPAEGYSEHMKQKHKRISLSPLTFPHEIAALLLIEQLYRVETIMAGKPYHK